MAVLASATYNPLADLPALPTMHHTISNCLMGPLPAPSMACLYPVDSHDELQNDYARITKAWPVHLGIGTHVQIERDAEGNPLWDSTILDRSLNETEVIQATTLCAATGASITISISPWGLFWGSGGSSKVQRAECPRDAKFLVCDPTVRGVAEAMEVRYFTEGLERIQGWIDHANKLLHTNVKIGGILLTSEAFYIDWSNSTQLAALTRKHDLMYNASRQFCDPAACTIEQYNRGTVTRDATLGKVSSPDGWVTWPGYAPCAGLGDTFATSLYTIPEVGYTREAYARTVAAASKCGIQHVTPWLWLGGGCRRRVSATQQGTSLCDDFKWDYDLEYSWMAGRELADPFYGQNPRRFAPWGAARRVAMFPSPFSADSWRLPPAVNTSEGAPPSQLADGYNVSEHLASSIGLRHFVAYVLGAADIRRME